jgi:Tol biopolymer transport system component
MQSRPNASQTRFSLLRRSAVMPAPHSMRDVPGNAIRLSRDVVAGLLILTALLAGCSISAQPDSAAIKPLAQDAWPTPRPTSAVPSPTPFPMVDPSQVHRLDDRLAPVVEVGLAPVPTVMSVPAPASTEPVPTSAPSGATAGVAPTARVRGPKGVNVRAGPGTAFPVVAALRAGDPVGVLGLNEQGRNWVFIQTTPGTQGWVSLPLLDLSSPADALPLVTASPPPAATPVRPPSIGHRPSVLVIQLSSGGDIPVVNADGSGLRRLTQGMDPVLSPDGKRVAFTRWDGVDGSLWVIGVDGSDEHQVAGGIKQAKHPTWSPDGKRVAVNLQHEGRLDPARKCASLASGEVPDIPWNVDRDSVKVEMRGQYPYIIPYLCYTAPPDPHWSVRIVDVDTGETQDQVTDTYAFGPAWDPATPWRIITSGLNGLAQMDINRQAVWALTDRREDHTPAFSPDGRYIAVAYDQGGRYEIHRLDAGGGGRLALTKSPLWLAAEGRQPWNNVAPAWSPDGSQIAFLTDRTGRWEIWVMAADGSDQRPLFDDALNKQLQFAFDFVDERMLSWGEGS